MSDAARTWGPFHRHFGSDVIWRDADCPSCGPMPSHPVYCFDPDYLREHEENIRADERIANGRQFTYEVGYSHGFAHAEADVARLTEERDAARAEVARLDEMNVKMAEHVARHHAEVAALRGVIAAGIEAFRLTKEYVNIPDEHGFVLLPDVPGWSHFDWTEHARALIEGTKNG